MYLRLPIDTDTFMAILYKFSKIILYLRLDTICIQINIMEPRYDALDYAATVRDEWGSLPINFLTEPESTEATTPD